MVTREDRSVKTGRRCLQGVLCPTRNGSTHTDETRRDERGIHRTNFAAAAGGGGADELVNLFLYAYR